MNKFSIAFVCSILSIQAFAQIAENETLDSLYIVEVENQPTLPDKVLHAEPLFIDLIRDLGARKGEKEWNVGLGLTDQNTHDKYTALVEYEWAPVNRLGVEVELPFSLYYPGRDVSVDSIPGSKLNGIKAAVQYSFFVSERLKTSMAIGYIHELEMNSFRNFGKEQLFVGNLYNPFFVAAKRWGQNFHTLIYTGPAIQHHFKTNAIHWAYQLNTNLHYMISGTRNFVGVELNKQWIGRDFDMTIRPQMRVSVAHNFLVGIVAGIPVKRELERFSTFVRFIYEPGHKHPKHTKQKSGVKK